MSFVSRSTQAVRAASRRASRSAVNTVSKTQRASYSLLARTAAAAPSKAPVVSVSHSYGKLSSSVHHNSIYRHKFVVSRLLTSLARRRSCTSGATGRWLNSRTTSRTIPLLSLAMAHKVMDRVSTPVIMVSTSLSVSERMASRGNRPLRMAG
jgi:hypothetical protein